MPNNYLSLTYDEILFMSDKAVLVHFGDENRWIPFSCIEPDSLADLSIGDRDGEIDVAAWFVKKEGLEGYES